MPDHDPRGEDSYISRVFAISRPAPAHYLLTLINLTALAFEHPRSASNLPLKVVASSRKMFLSITQLERVLRPLR